MQERSNGNLSKGDVVVVKKGARDPDFDIPIGGWQGRIEDAELDEDGTWLYGVAWDSVTLWKMKRKIIAQCAEDGLDWERTYISEKDLKPVEARDTQADVDRIRFGLSLYASWYTPQKSKKR